MTQDSDTYWNNNTILGEGILGGEKSLIRLKLHRSEERYFHKEELFPLSTRSGTRIYFHAKPYILIPDITLTIALSPRPAPDGAIGEVIGSDVKKLKPLILGNAQAWYYPAENAVVFWECFLEEHYQTAADPRHDTLLSMVWTGFERILLEQLHPVERIYTTYEPIYERPVFTKFLRQLGYRKQGKVAFVKEIPRKRDEEHAS